MKQTLIALGVVVIVAAAYVGYTKYGTEQGTVAGTDYKQATYYISGEPVRLGEKGVTYFGNEVRGDFSGDGVEDVAFLITQQPGGSGTFFYLAGAVGDGKGGYRGTNAMFIGDRIAPQTTNFKDGLVVVNYADRKPTDPMVTPPSVGKSLYARYSSATNDFGEVVQNFEGESR